MCAPAALWLKWVRCSKTPAPFCFTLHPGFLRKDTHLQWQKAPEVCPERGADLGVWETIAIGHTAKADTVQIQLEHLHKKKRMFLTGILCPQKWG